MSGKAPKSILKKSGSASQPSSSKAGPSTLAKNTKQNSVSASGSKLKKSISVGRPRQQKKQESESEDDDDEEDEGEDEEMSQGDGEDESEVDTDEEIRRAAGGASDKKKGQKRKRITTAETFGSTLTALLAEPAQPKKQKKAATTEPAATVAQPGSAILSKSMAKAPPSKTEDKLEWKAQRKLKALKEEKEDRARVRDVVEGWMAADGTGGMEFEKGLRKTAQRGVIKLFNAILVAAKNAEAAKTTLSAKAGVKPEVGKRKEKDNVLGRGGKEAGLTQEGFLDLVRKG